MTQHLENPTCTDEKIKIKKKVIFKLYCFIESLEKIVAQNLQLKI